MSYAQLVAEMKLDARQFDRELTRRDNQMRAMVQRTYEPKLKIDTSSLHRQIAQVQNVLANIKPVSIPVNLQSGSVRSLSSQMSGLDRIGQSIVGWAKQFGNTVARWAVGYAVVGNLIKGVNSLKYAFIDFNVLLENSRIVLTTLLDGSRKNADLLLNKLREFAKVTPFEFKDLVPLAQRLIGLGVIGKDEALTQLTGKLRAIGNAVAALGGSPEVMDRVVYAFGNMVQKGKASAEEVTKQLGNANIPAIRYMAEVMGKTTAEVFKLMKQGAIAGKGAVDAIIYGMDNDPKYKDQMKNLSKTFQGAFSNLKDSANEVLSKAFSPFFEQISKMAQNAARIANTAAFAEWAQKIGTQIGDAFRTLGVAIAWAYGQFTDKMPYIIGALTVLGSPLIINGITNLGNALMVAFAKVSLPILIATAAVIGFIAAYREFPAVQEATESVVGGTMKFLDQLSKTVYYLAQRTTLMFKGISMGASFIIGTLSAPMQKLLDIIQLMQDSPIFGGLVKSIPGLGGKIKELQDFAINVGRSLDARGAENTARDFYDGILKGLDDSAKDSGKYWEGAAKNWSKSGNAAFKKFMLGDMSGAVGDFGFAEMLKKAQEQADKALAELRPKKPNLADMYVNGGADGKGDKSALRTLTAIASAYDKLAKAAEDSGKRQLDALKGVRDTMRDIFGTIQDELAKYGVLHSPLDGVIDRIQRLMNLGPKAQGIFAKTLHTIEGFQGRAAGARRVAQTLQDKMSAATGASATGATATITPVTNIANAAKSASNAMLLQMAKSFSTGEPYYSCAFVASRLANAIGANIATTARAGDLRKNAMAANWTQVQGAIQKGDLIFNPRYGKNRGSGWHVKTAVGNGQVVNSNHREETLYDYHRKANEEVWRSPRMGAGLNIPSLAGKVVPAGLRNAMGVGNQAALTTGDNAQAFMDEVQSLLRDLKVSKLAELPKEWGKPIKDAAGQANQFKVQMLLANDATQAMLRSVLGPKKFPEFVRLLKEGSFASDQMLRSLQINADLQAELNEGTRAARARNQENNPLFNLRSQYVKNGRAQVPIFALANREAQIRSDVFAQAAKSIEKLKSVERDRIAVLHAGAPFLQEATRDMAGYARAIELAQNKINYARTDPIMLNLFAMGKSGDGVSMRQFNSNLSEYAKLDAQRYDSTKGAERGDAVRSMRREYEQTTKALRANLEIVKNSTEGENALNDKLAIRETILKRTQEFLALNFSKSRANELANEAARREQNNRLTERAIELQKAFNIATADSEDALSRNAQIRALYGSMGGDNPRLQMMIARMSKGIELDRMAHFPIWRKRAVWDFSPPVWKATSRPRALTKRAPG